MCVSSYFQFERLIPGLRDADHPAEIWAFWEDAKSLFRVIASFSKASLPQIPINKIVCESFTK